MYGKHFESMYSGSMVGTGAKVFAVWGYIISHQKPPLFDVELNPTILAVILGEAEEEIVKVIERFCQPDLKSRSKAQEGRKLLKTGEYLYHVVNGEEYHKIRTNEERRAYWREQKQRQKENPIAPRTTPVNPSPKKPQAAPKEINGESESPTHAAFIQGWSDNFKAFWKFDYAFEGGRDGKAVKELLKLNILSIDLLELAKSAWAHDGFNCKQASTIHGFKEKLNNIRTELKTIKKPAYRSTITGNY